MLGERRFFGKGRVLHEKTTAILSEDGGRSGSAAEAAERAACASTQRRP